MARSVVIHLAAGDPRTGLWCPDCALPSAIEVDVLWMKASGVTRLGTHWHCLDCGRTHNTRERPC